MHPLFRGHFGQAIHTLRGEELAISVAEVSRGLVDGQADDLVRVGRNVGQRDRAADRVAVQVEPVITPLGRQPVEGIDL
jgi:hypothetical protein